MKAYVAGSMYDSGLEYVKMIQDAFRVCGHEISYDWTAQPISETGGPHERQELAEAERGGVLNADILILLDHNRPRGALIETGMALGADKDTLVLIEEGRNPSLFYHLPNCTIITSHDNLLRAIELLPDKPYCDFCDGKGYHEPDRHDQEPVECPWCEGTGQHE